MAVIVANVYQQAAMCVTEKHRAPRWLTKFALSYMSPLLHMDDKVKAVLSQTVSEDVVYVFFRNNRKFMRLIGCFFLYAKTREIDDA
jgi:hypothetical protein